MGRLANEQRTLRDEARAKYARPSSKRVPPLPPEFVQQFVEGGWRRIERVYGGRNDLVRKWMVLAGGERKMKAMRREHLLKARGAERAIAHG